MKLKEYLSNKGLTQELFGQQVGVSRVQITKVVNGRIIPSKKLLEKIEKVTDGQVSSKDFSKRD